MWRKSSRSNDGGDGNCVEIALNDSAARVRDSKNTGTAIAVPDWSAFLTAVKSGEFSS